MNEYLSIDAQLIKDAERYLERAKDYILDGKLNHASGCLKKAIKKLDKTNYYFTCDPILRPMIDQLSKNVANSLLKDLT